MALLLFVVTGCSCSSGVELLSLEVDAEIANADTQLSITLEGSRGLSPHPTVTVAGFDADLDGTTVVSGDSELALYHFSYIVTGEEQEGVVSIVAVAVGSRGREVSIEETIVFDFTPPRVVDLTASPSAQRTESTYRTFTFDCSEDGCTYRCGLDGAMQGVVSDATDCESGVGYTDLSDDDYTFTVVATDPAGNESEPATSSWIVDTAEPTVSIRSGPDALTNATTAAFEFECSKSVCSFECGLHDPDGAELEGPSSCTSPVTYSRLDDGEYVFSVVAVDALDRESEPATWSWRIDTVEPIVEITQAPDERTTARTIVFFEFECSNKECERFDCAADHYVGGVWQEGDWAQCVSPAAKQHLDPGRNRLRIRARDAAGNEGHAGHEWTVVPSRWSSFAAGGRRILFIGGGRQFDAHTCGIAANGSLWCWGYGWSGQLGVGAEHEACDESWQCPLPLQVGSDVDWAEVSTGGNHTCAIKEDGGLWCWGADWTGQIGVGGNHPDCVEQGCFSPLEVEPNEEWVHVSAGEGHTCAIKSDSTLWCWGSNYSDQSSYFCDEQSCAEPVEVLTPPWTDASAGLSHTCAITQHGWLYCWGNNNNEQLGRDCHADGCGRPHNVDTEDDWARVFSGTSYTCATKSDGRLWCWGFAHGLGPTEIGDAESWAEMSSGGFGFCAVKDEGTMWRLNQETFEMEQSLGDDDDWTSVSVGDEHVCGLREGGGLWCLGKNNRGALGDGSLDDSLDWVLVGSSLE